MNKILINIPDLENKGGVAQYYNNLLLNKESNIDYFNIHNHSQNVLLRLFTTYFKFMKVVKNYDVVVLNPSLNKKSFFRDGIFALLAKQKRKKLIIFWHGWQEPYEKKIIESFSLKKFFEFTFLKADGLIILGDVFYRKLVNLGLPTSLPYYKGSMLLPCEYDDLSLDLKERIIESKEFNILFLSRIVKGKGVNICIDLAHLLAKKYPYQQIIMHIAGDGEELVNMKTYAHSLGLTNVVFHGYVRNQAKINLFKKADVFFFPSETEGFPNVVVEALFFGLPVITRPVGALSEIISHGKNGYLYESNNAEDFVKYFDPFVINRIELNQMAKVCHQEAVLKYSYFNVRKRVIDFYNAC